SIGPRYLVALVPFLGFFGMVALARLSRRASVMAAALGLGLLLAGFVSASLPSIYYPHLMPEISVPVSQLMPVLLGHDFAPYNAGNLVSWYGSASMAPLLLVAFFAARRSTPTARELPSLPARAGVVGGATLLAALVVVQHFVWEPEETPEVRRAVAFVCEQWAPAGHDRATRLAPSQRIHDVALLVDLLRDEGRDREADLTQRHLDGLRAAEDTRARRGNTP
ncbi:MAG: hypothetical protein KBB95_10925, partial [Deltaproteobacteria bacterium]|nr:hypothetical protein [Deltaproteobacteria bacterium]